MNVLSSRMKGQTPGDSGNPVSSGIIILLLYGLVAVANVFAYALHWANAGSITKVLLLPLLIVYVWSLPSARKRRVPQWVMESLLFSWVGDVLLIFEEQDELFFVMGLASYVVAHSLYIVVFWKLRNTYAGGQGKVTIYAVGAGIVLLLVYICGFMVILWPYITALVLPTVVYACAMGGMGITALRRAGCSNRESFLLVMVGVLGFMASDTMRALHMFVPDVWINEGWIMAANSTAQVMVVLGIMRHLPPQGKG